MFAPLGSTRHGGRRVHLDATAASEDRDGSEKSLGVPHTSQFRATLTPNGSYRNDAHSPPPIDQEGPHISFLRSVAGLVISAPPADAALQRVGRSACQRLLKNRQVCVARVFFVIVHLPMALPPSPRPGSPSFGPPFLGGRGF